MMLATESDIEVFVYEKSPHVKAVEVSFDEDDNVWRIKVTLQFWYRFFYEKTFYAFIVEQINENGLYGMSYDVTLTS